MTSVAHAIPQASKKEEATNTHQMRNQCLVLSLQCGHVVLEVVHRVTNTAKNAGLVDLWTTWGIVVNGMYMARRRMHHQRADTHTYTHTQQHNQHTWVSHRYTGEQVRR